VKGVINKDHVHILVTAPPSLAPSEIMRRIKGRTGNYLLVRGCAFEKALLGEAFWARYYFCATVGQMTEKNDPAVLGVSF
jgi:putative transposase